MATRDNPNDTYLTDLIDLLRPYTGGLSRQQVMTMLEQVRKSRGTSIPPKFEQAVQSVFNRHCNQSDTLPASEEGFFNSMHDGKHAIWSLDAPSADAWLRTQSPLYLLAQAIGRIKGVPTEKALDAVKKADEAQLRDWRSNAKVKAAQAEIRAEQAREALEREERLIGKDV